MIASVQTNPTRQEEAPLAHREAFFDVQYMFTLLLCQNLHFYYRHSSAMFHALVRNLLENSIQFLWHLVQQMLS